MKNQLLFIIMFLGLGGGAWGQNPLVKQWDKRFGGTGVDFLTCLNMTSDSGFILGGYSASGVGGVKTQPLIGYYDYWIVKTDSSGIKQWDKTFGGPAGNILMSCQQTKDGGYILGGSSIAGAGGDKSQPTWGIWDYWIVKTDSLGNKLWDKDFGGTQYEQLYSLAQTMDGGYILGGYSRSGIGGDKTDTLRGYHDYWIVKIDSLGNKQWDKTYGGTNNDQLLSLKQTTDGGYVLGGSSKSRISCDKTVDNWDTLYDTSDYWIIKIDSIGNKLWDKDYGGTDYDVLTFLKQTRDLGFILVGESSSGIGGDKSQASYGSMDQWIVKIDSLGNKQWDKDFGALNNDGNEISNTIETSDGGYLIGGDSYSMLAGGSKTENNIGAEQTWIIKIDSLGNKQWDKTILEPGHDDFAQIVLLNDGCYVIANSTEGGIGGYSSTSSYGDYDYWLIKFCDNTFYYPATNLSSTDTSFCEKHCLDFFDLSTNNPTSWQWFFPGSDSLTSTLQNPINICYNSYGSYDVTLIACNAAGCDTLHLTNFINCYQNPKDSIYQSNDTLFSLPAYAYQWYEVTNGIIAGATNQYFVPQQGGSYYCVITDSVGCAGSSGAIVITGVNQLAVGNWQLAIVPNPFNDNITITFQNQNITKASLTIKNVLGQEVYGSAKTPSRVFQPLKGSAQIDLSSLPQGIYFLEIMMNDVSTVKKIVKQ